MNGLARDLSNLIAAGLALYFVGAVLLSWRRDDTQRSIGRWERFRRSLAEACGADPPRRR